MINFYILAIDLINQSIFSLIGGGLVLMWPRVVLMLKQLGGCALQGVFPRTTILCLLRWGISANCHELKQVMRAFSARPLMRVYRDAGRLSSCETLRGPFM